MPQIVAAVLIGAGIAAGVKWLVREMSAQAGRLAGEDAGRPQPVREPVRVKPRDLGALEYDAETGVYRPSGKRAG